MTNEEHLIAEAAINPGAFAALYDHYFSRVYTYVRYRVESDAAADDLTAQIFHRALERIREYDPDRAPFAAWLFGIARYAVGNHRRGLWRWLGLDAVLHKPNPSPPLEEITIQREAEDRLLRAVSKLDDREQDVIGLKYGAGMTNREIASLIGVSESNVGVILHRAIKRLRERLPAGMEKD